jgi:hypothetical protein
LLRPNALETTRELACRFLAEVASTDASLHLLQAVASSKPWYNSKRVRDAAREALDRLNKRAQAALDARKSAVDVKRTEEGARATRPPGTRTTGAKKTARKTGSGSRPGAARSLAPKTASGAATVPPVPTAAADGGTDAKDGKTAMRKKRPNELAAEPPATPARRASTATGD